MKITAAGTELPDGDRMMRIRVVESGEEVDDRFTTMLVTPRGVDVRYRLRPRGLDNMQRHPKGVSQAYAGNGNMLANFGGTQVRLPR